MVHRNRNSSNLVRFSQIQQEVNENNLKQVDTSTPIHVKAFALCFIIAVVAVLVFTK